MRRWLPLSGLCWVLSCSESEPSSTCANHEDCSATEFCVSKACVPRSTLQCGEGESTQISVSAEVIEFGSVGATDVHKTLEVRNAGDCTLRIGTWQLEARAESRFRCLTCEENALPFEIAPKSDLTLDLAAVAGTPGTFSDRLEIRSSDPEHEYTYVTLQMSSVGAPELIVAPEVVDFGYVPGGSSTSRVVSVVNSGGSPVSITRVAVEGVDSSDFDLPALSLPYELGAARTDPSAKLDLNLGYSPIVAGRHTSELVVEASGLEPVRVALESLADPPDFQSTASTLDFGTVRTGREAAKSFTMQNTGRAPLSVTAVVSGTSRSEFALTRDATTVPAGGFFELGVKYQPTTVGQASAKIILNTNDPDTPTSEVTLRGTGEAPPPGDEVAVIDLEFRVDSASLIDTDIRDVDLILESPLGGICSESNRTPNWGAEGQPRWTGGAGRGSERIVLAGATQDGEYVIGAQYIEDCSSLPTQLAARLLGVGTQEVTEYFSDGEVMLDANRVSGIVSSLCVQHSEADARVTVTINGTRVVDRALSMPAAGATDTLRLIRADGRFRVQ